MRTSSAGKTTSRQAGITLLEMMIVTMLVALIAGISYPSVSSGLDTIRLRSAGDSIVSLLNTSLERANRRQQPVEIQIRASDGTLTARSADLSFVRQVEISRPVFISSILPPVPANAGDMRRVIVYPGGGAPQIGVELSTADGRKRVVSIDPITGVSQSK